MIGGGACAYNPEPLAPFFDLFYIGEGEMVYGALFDAYKANQKAGGSRQDFLLKAAQIPGIYVPSLYQVTYKEDGTIESFQPKYENVPEKVEKQLVIDMDKDYNKLEARSFLISRQHRIVLLWKSSVAVSADAVSARLA